MNRRIRRIQSNIVKKNYEIKKVKLDGVGNKEILITDEDDPGLQKYIEAKR